MAAYETMERNAPTCGCGNIIEYLIGKIIAGDDGEIACLYKVAITRPWSCLVPLARTWSWKPFQNDSKDDCEGDVESES